MEELKAQLARIGATRHLADIEHLERLMRRLPQEVQALWQSAIVERYRV